MKAKPTPSRLISELPPGDIDLVPGRSARITCPSCGHWVKIKRSLVEGHADRTGETCSETAQHYTFDLVEFRRNRTLVAEQHRVERYADARGSAIDPQVRHRTSAHGVLAPPVPAPVHRLAALPAQTSVNLVKADDCTCLHCKARRTRTAAKAAAVAGR